MARRSWCRDLKAVKTLLLYIYTKKREKGASDEEAIESALSELRFECGVLTSMPAEYVRIGKHVFEPRETEDGVALHEYEYLGDVEVAGRRIPILDRTAGHASIRLVERYDTDSGVFLVQPRVNYGLGVEPVELARMFVEDGWEGDPRAAAILGAILAYKLADSEPRLALRVARATLDAIRESGGVNAAVLVALAAALARVESEAESEEVKQAAREMLRELLEKHRDVLDTFRRRAVEVSRSVKEEIEDESRRYTQAYKELMEWIEKLRAVAEELAKYGVRMEVSDGGVVLVREPVMVECSGYDAVATPEGLKLVPAKCNVTEHVYVASVEDGQVYKVYLPSLGPLIRVYPPLGKLRGYLVEGILKWRDECGCYEGVVPLSMMDVYYTGVERALKLLKRGYRPRRRVRKR